MKLFKPGHHRQQACQKHVKPLSILNNEVQTNSNFIPIQKRKKKERKRKWDPARIKSECKCVNVPKWLDARRVSRQGEMEEVPY